MTKKGLDGLRKPGAKPTANNNLVFSVENGNLEVVKKKSDKVQIGQMNLVGDIVENVSDVITQISQSVEKVKTAQMKLDEIRETSRAQVKVAEELTKKTEIEETEKTRRYIQETQVEISKIQRDMDANQAAALNDQRKIDQEHERNMYKLSQNEKALDMILNTIHDLQEEMKSARSQGIVIPSELQQELQDNMKMLVSLSQSLSQSKQ